MSNKLLYAACVCTSILYSKIETATEQIKTFFDSTLDCSMSGRAACCVYLDQAQVHKNKTIEIVAFTDIFYYVNKIIIRFICLIINSTLLFTVHLLLLLFRICSSTFFSLPMKFGASVLFCVCFCTIMWFISYSIPSIGSKHSIVCMSSILDETI